MFDYRVCYRLQVQLYKEINNLAGTFNLQKVFCTNCTLPGRQSLVVVEYRAQVSLVRILMIHMKCKIKCTTQMLEEINEVF